MGSVDESRAAAAQLRQQYAEVIGQLQAIEQGVGEAAQELRGRLGNTSHPKILEAEGRCREAQSKITAAIQSLSAASEAATQLTASMG